MGGAGSLPASPDHVPAASQAQRQIQRQDAQQNRTSMSLLSSGFPWLNALPKIQMRKSKFSPWEDEETKELEEA